MDQFKIKTTPHKTATLIITLLSIMIVSANLHAQAEKFPDPLLTTPGTPEVVRKGLEADGYSLGVMSYIWGYPLVKMESVIREYIDVPDPKTHTSIVHR